jgi:hypothetical protein
MAEHKEHGRKRRYHPCVIYELQTYNPEHQEGYRYRIHDIDDDQMYFHEKDRMAYVVELHGFRPVLPAKMEELRRQRNSV